MFDMWLDLVWTSIVVRARIVVYVRDQLRLSVNCEDEMRAKLGIRAKLWVKCSIKL